MFLDMCHSSIVYYFKYHNMVTIQYSAISIIVLWYHHCTVREVMRSLWVTVCALACKPEQKTTCTTFPNLISLHLSGSAMTESTVNIKPNCICILSYCYLAMEVFVILEIKSKNEREWTWNYRLNDKKCLSQNASERTDILRELSISSRDKINSCLTSLNAFFHLVFSSSTFRYANFPRVPALQTSVSA